MTNLIEQIKMKNASDVSSTIATSLRERTLAAIQETRLQVAAETFGDLSETTEDLNEVLVHGKKLTPAQHTEVLAAFVHRYTGEHKPRWAASNTPDGNKYKPTHSTDKDWVHDHAFHMNKKTGRLSQRNKHAEPSYLADFQER